MNDIKTIMKRLEALESKKDCIPTYTATFKDGKKKRMRGFPLLGEYAEITEAEGGEFGKLINVLVHPVKNRDIEELEKEKE